MLRRLAGHPEKWLRHFSGKPAPYKGVLSSAARLVQNFACIAIAVFAAVPPGFGQKKCRVLRPGKQPPKEDIEEITSMMSGRIIGMGAGCVKQLQVYFILPSLLVVFASFFIKFFGFPVCLPTLFCVLFCFFEVFCEEDGFNSVCCCGFLCLSRELAGRCGFLGLQASAQVGQFLC